MKQSEFLKINWYDVSKSLILAFLTTFLTAITISFDAGALPTMHDIKVAALTGLGAAVSYLLKNWLTNSNGSIAVTEPKKNTE